MTNRKPLQPWSVASKGFVKQQCGQPDRFHTRDGPQLCKVKVKFNFISTFWPYFGHFQADTVLRLKLTVTLRSYEPP